VVVKLYNGGVAQAVTFGYLVYWWVSCQCFPGTRGARLSQLNVATPGGGRRGWDTRERCCLTFFTSDSRLYCVLCGLTTDVVIATRFSYNEWKLQHSNYVNSAHAHGHIRQERRSVKGFHMRFYVLVVRIRFQTFTALCPAYINSLAGAEGWSQQ